MQSAAVRAQKAAQLSLLVTVVIVVMKLAAGYVTGAISVLAEGLQSLVDVVIAFGVVQTIRLAAKPPDEDHPYGHGKAEVLMSALQMILIMGTAGFIISQAYGRLLRPQEISVDWGMLAMGVSAVANTLVSVRLNRIAKETNSTALAGEVLHLRSDAVSSAGIFVGLFAVFLTGWTQLDPLIAIAFTMVVVVTAIRQLREVVHLLMEGSANADEIALIEKTLKNHPQVRGFHNLRARTVGSTHHVDLHVLLDDDLSFVEAHDLAEEVEAAISDALGRARVNVHYEPYHAERAHQHEAHGEIIP